MLVFMRIDQLTFTRFVAAILIVVFHFGSESFPFNSGSLSFVISQANVGVSYFFILSGFVMMIAYGDKDKINTIAFLRNRLARIYPVYFLSLMLLFIYYVSVIFAPISPVDLILNIILLKAWVPNKATIFNSPGWTLSVELFFYILFPFVFNWFYRKGSNIIKLALPIVSFWLISQLILHWFLYSELYKGYPSESHNFIYYWPLMHFNEFLIGNLAGLIFLQQKKERVRNYDWQILGILILILLALKYHGPLIFHNGLLALLFVPFILFLSLNTGKITEIFKNRFLVFLGEISFGVYILQLPVYFFSMLFFDKSGIQDGTMRFYLFVIILITFSSMTYAWIESPLRKRIKQIYSNKNRI
ncbi:MAG: acyltransferase 3 [Cytophagaceae bacterium]|jgi:peptidoglycan/LPS O-acetylase OafA/YrhL|nr:acyltransferase 3 [Cytophagaceae bacterium]